MGSGGLGLRNAAVVFLASAALAGACAPAVAKDASDEAAPRRDEKDAAQGAVAWKFTPTWHDNSSGPNAWDFNLRGNTDTQTWWAGYYQRSEEFRQLRLGYEHPLDLGFARLVPSIQYATRGFLGGSLYGESSGDWFGILGWGRTNLKDYFNLNFDPNDAVTFGVGTRVLPKTTLNLYQVRDDRLHTGQRITHLVARIKPDEKTRWTIDAFYKEGRPDSDPASARIHGAGATVTYDFDRYFVRVAIDPHVNFSDIDAVRVAFGFRF
jgi:hypothetical protein